MSANLNSVKKKGTILPDDPKFGAEQKKNKTVNNVENKLEQELLN